MAQKLIIMQKRNLEEFFGSLDPSTGLIISFLFYLFAPPTWPVLSLFFSRTRQQNMQHVD